MSHNKSLPPTFIDGFHETSGGNGNKMKYRQLGQTGLCVSALSLGASSLGSVFRSTQDAESRQVVHTALRNGINYIDTAPWYGQGKSETVLGKALETVPRKAYYISTKVGRYQSNIKEMFNFKAEKTLQSVEESLQKLQLDFVDIIQVHDVEFAPSLEVIINETLPALKKVQDSGKAKLVGITGYPLETLKAIIERSSVKIDTVLSYCHYSMNDTSLLTYLPFFEESKVGVINASPISMGLLSHRGPPDWHPATPQIKLACREAAEYCQSKGVDLSTLATHFSLAEEKIPTTLVSTASLTNLDKNLKSVRQKLSTVEAETMKIVMDRYFTPLKNKTWQGIEVKEYWDKLEALKGANR